MSVAALLAELRSRDIRVWPDGDQLRCNAPVGVLTSELRAQLHQRKRDIVEFLRSAETLARQERAIVPLQPRGDLVPVFAVPGHNGNVFSFRTLAQHLGEDQPFYGLQPPGVEGEARPLTSVEGLAAYLATRILTFRPPPGSCVIVGHCSGGTIAFELARQLHQRGATIPLVALFASPYPSSWRVSGRLRRRLDDYVKRAHRHARALASLSYRERSRYLTAFLRRLLEAKPEATDVPPPDASPDLAALTVKIQTATIAGVRRYTPRYFDGRLSLFLPNAEWRHSGEGALRWGSMARETEVSCGPDGCEGDRILLEPYAAGTAELFRRCRDRWVPKL